VFAKLTLREVLGNKSIEALFAPLASIAAAAGLPARARAPRKTQPRVAAKTQGMQLVRTIWNQPTKATDGSIAAQMLDQPVEILSVGRV
jgi:hypothetical protein